MRFGLVDCNNFYCSAERVFRPDLNGKPLVVLSNNDGCAVARSNEAKALGIAMSQPFFEIRHLVKQAGLVALSSNYALYGDISHRVMSVLTDAAPAVEVYSIDESFLDLDNMAVPDLTLWCRDLRTKVLRWTGIPVSIGIGPTKTIAKVANRLAKKSPKAGGVLDLTNRPEWIAEALRRTNVGDVWGIGRQWAKACASAGIVSALDLAQADIEWVRTTMGKVGLRTVMELQGTAVLSLETEPADRKTCCVSRSFGQATDCDDEVGGALIDYASRAGEKLRKDGLVAAAIQVFIQTDPFRKDQPQRFVSASSPLSPATADSTRLVRAAIQLLDKLWRPGFHYRKCGVLLLDLVRPEDVPPDLFITAPSPRQARLMAALDAANGRFGRGALHLGLSPPTAAWPMRRDAKTPSYTTDWREIPIVST